VGVHKGHRVLIDTKAPVADGDIVLVAVAGEEFASLRQIYREGDGVLVVANGLGQRPSVHKPSDVRIVGKMVFGRYYPGQRQG
jgi:SOS-response transcriptional repressor LexA